MAGFAIHVQALLSKPDVWVGFDELGDPTQRGYLETRFLEKFTSRDTVECRGNNREVCLCTSSSVVYLTVVHLTVPRKTTLYLVHVPYCAYMYCT